jgi:hypothetical protein
MVKKHQTRFDGFDDKIVSMYARGMTTRDIQGHLEEIYGVEVSPTLISNVTDAVVEEVKSWQSRPLEAVYPILYLDALQVKIRDAGHVQNRAIYVAVGIKLDGDKEVLWLWAGQAEGAKFGLQVVTELKNRGVQDIFIACVDGLKGLPPAIETVFPKAQVQLCIVHLVRNPGPYNILVTAEGFKTAERKGITLQTADIKQIDIALEVGANTERVTVTAEAELIDTTSATSVITPEAVAEMPSLSRVPTLLAGMSPGVARQPAIQLPHETFVLAAVTEKDAKLRTRHPVMLSHRV